MGNIIKKVQRERLVYWEPDEPNSYGEPVWHPAIEMSCRWDHMSVEIITQDNSPVYSKIALVTEKELVPGSIVWKGTLEECPYPGDPKRNTGAYEVLKVARTPDIRARRFLYEAWA